MDSDTLLKYINESYREKIISGDIIAGVPTFVVKPENWVTLGELLRDDKDTLMHSISNYGAVDFREKLGGYQLVITVFSHIHNHRVTIKTLLPATGDKCPGIDTISIVWPSALWFEREIIELFGIIFNGHPDPRHLILDDDWDEGYPMRRGWTGSDFIIKPDK